MEKKSRGGDSNPYSVQDEETNDDANESAQEDEETSKCS
jgi:hypothetical protein